MKLEFPNCFEEFRISALGVMEVELVVVVVMVMVVVVSWL